jgi:acetyltransferase-like isoleucine patch superfamily enzyme
VLPYALCAFEVTGLRRDHRPYFVKKAYLLFQQFYVRRFLSPQFEALGAGHTFMRPWHVEIFGSPIRIGKFANVIAAPDQWVRFAVWPAEAGRGAIDIGDYCLISPGVRVSSADGIRIGDNCMLANGVYLTDSDWHDLYNRTVMGRTAPIEIGANVWIGDSAIVCKGVSLGENSIIGAGAVVVQSVPANCVAAGNPARVVKELDREQTFTTRKQWFQDPSIRKGGLDEFDRDLLKGNTLRHWLRYLLFPSRGD